MLKKFKGFSLIEVLIVAVVLGVLAAIIIPSILGQVHKAKEAEAVQSLGSIRLSELNLHGMAGQFVAAADETEIKSALGLALGGGFYRYKIIDATQANFLAIATPLDLLDNWLQEIAIDKDGFVGYSPIGTGSVSGGVSSGGSSGGGSSDGGSGGGSGGGSAGGTGTVVGGGNSRARITTSGPVFNGYAENIQGIFDVLGLSTVALSSSGMGTGAALATWLLDNEVDVQFGSPGAGAGAVTRWNNTTHLPYIEIGAEYQVNKYVCAMYLAHEALHAVWFLDEYRHTTTDSDFEYGVTAPRITRTTAWDDGGEKGTIDQEYNAYITGAQVWKDLKKQYDVGMNVSGYGPSVDEHASHFVNDDGTLRSESEAKEWIRGLDIYEGLPEY